MIYTVDELKTQLSILFVLSQYGHEGNPCLCPFHADTVPSLDIFSENKRWGCFPCGNGGDVLDLIQKLDGISEFVLVKDRADVLLEEQLRSEWVEPTPRETRTFDIANAVDLTTSSVGNAPGPWLALHAALAAERPRLRDTDPETVRLDFRLGVQGSQTIVPYFNRDMELIAYKRRSIGDHIKSAPGTSFKDVLYAEWLDDGIKPVLLCEGESDVWAATYALPDYAVLGIPTGAGSYTSQAGSLASRQVTLAFDGDNAGRLALRKWHNALKNIADVKIAIMPDGVDLCNVSDIRATVESARPVPPTTDRQVRQEDGIYRPVAGDRPDVQLTNWVVDPKRLLSGDGETAWECDMQPLGDSVVLTTHDLGSNTAITEWTGRHDGSWFGTGVDAQHLQAYLQSEQPFLGSGRFSSVAGLHENHFVFPGESIGPDHWVYAPGNNDIEMHKYMCMHPDGPWHFSEQLETMRQLHSPEIMDPILSWLAVAPLRSLINPFPALAVLGGSGTGKTTLIETVLRAFSGAEISANLTSTTPFAIQGFVAATNAFPVWFDEYRPGAGEVAKATLDQIVRDAYNGHGSVKGGMGKHWAQIRSLPSNAPLIVSGEDAFTETSHLERIIPIYLPPEGRNPDILAEIQSWKSKWSYRWLEILRYRLALDNLDLTIPKTELEMLAPRMNHNLGVLRLGWSLLAEMAQRIDGHYLSAPHFDRVYTSWAEDASSDVIRDAIIWAMEEVDAHEFLTITDSHVHVRVRNFTNYVSQYGKFVLPGNEKAIRRYLIEQLNGFDTRADILNKRVRTIGIPLETLNE